MKNIPIVVLLNEKELADKFFNITNMPFPSCGCAKTNWDYGKETAYKIDLSKPEKDRYEFGNIRMYNSKLTGNVHVYTVEGFLKWWENNKLLIDVEFEEVKSK